MKLTRFAALMMATLTAGATMSSCDKDDDEDISDSVVKAYSDNGLKSADAASYSLASSKYFKDMFTDETGNAISISKLNAEAVSVSFTSKTWGEFSIDTVKILSSDGAYALSGNGTCKMAGMNGKVSEYAASFSAKMSAGVLSDVAFSAPSVMGGTTVYYLTGEAPAGYVVAGSYGTYSKANSKYFSDMLTEEKANCLSLKAVENGSKVSVSFSSEKWGTFSVEAATVSKEGDKYVIEGNGSCEMAGMSGQVSTYEVSVKGTINGKSTVVDFSIPAVMGGTTVSVYNDSMPTTEAK
ncbi:MAG: hypothetical protein II951_00590 [Bacteroidales bacterium]|nr:hypothetical protein [Bacteroidales bacterium]